MDNYLEILRSEFEAEDDSFLIKLRSELVWDQAAFNQLSSAMKVYCERQVSTEPVERWLARGFWYVPTFVKDWTTHPNFPKVYPAEYYESAYRRLDDLAFWFFFGESSFEKDSR